MMIRKMSVVKRIAFAAADINRKSLIEWSYYNQGILKNHELIAAGIIADILEGTIGVTVTRLADGPLSANQQLTAMVAEQALDILLFFWDPLQLSQPANGIQALYDSAVVNNIIVVSNPATAEFVLSSVLMNKTHAVPVTTSLTGNGRSYTGNGSGSAQPPLLKLNYIN